jgi:hypothetical protein
VKFPFIADHHQESPVTVRCDALEVAVSGFSAWRKREPGQHGREDAKLAEQINVTFQAQRGV